MTVPSGKKHCALAAEIIKSIAANERAEKFSHVFSNEGDVEIVTVDSILL
jgi:hypothetical protein